MVVHDIYSGRDELLGYARALPPPARHQSGLLAILWRRKLVVLAALLACLAGGVAVIALTPPRYEATAAMLIDPRLGRSVGNDPNAPGFIADTAAIDSQIKLFTSQTVLARVAAEAGLSSDPEFNGKSRSLLQRLLHPGVTTDGGVDLRALEQAITIKRPERTYVVEVDVLARDPQKAAEIANGLTRAYIDDQVSARLAAARGESSYIAQNLDKLSAQIRTLDDQIEGYKAKNKIVEAAGLRSDEQQVADLTKTLGDARAKASDAKARLDEVERLAKGGHLDGTADALKSITMERLRQQQADAEGNVARLARTLGSRHPALQEAEDRQAKMRALIRDELGRLKASAEADYGAARAHEAQINAAVAGLKAQSAKASQALVPLDQMERNRTVLRASFDRFAQVNGTIAQQEATSPPGRVIAVARAPVSPSSPRKTVVGLAALSAGLFFGVAGALFAEGAARAPDAPPPEPAPALPAERIDPEARLLRRRRYWDDDA